MNADMNLIQLMQDFDTDEECRTGLEELRWPNGVHCLKCDSLRVSRIPSRHLFQCNACTHQFSVITGTIFHGTHLPLTKWILATYLMVESKKGISANQMKRTLGVSYKTAWYLCHRIRAAMSEASPTPLSGIVEVDETYVGGVTKGMGHGYKGNKTMVIGAVVHGGEIRLKVGKRGDRKTLLGFIRDNTKPETEDIYTDDWPAYKGIGDHATRHETVNHSANEWVRGSVHTNSVEGVWSLFNRSLVGAFHNISTKHLDAYLDELEWRVNNRENKYLFRDTLRKLLSAETLEYKRLIAN
jgi:transposase-like protein